MWGAGGASNSKSIFLTVQLLKHSIKPGESKDQCNSRANCAERISLKFERGARESKSDIVSSPSEYGAPRENLLGSDDKTSHNCNVPNPDGNLVDIQLVILNPYVSSSSTSTGPYPVKSKSSDTTSVPYACGLTVKAICTNGFTDTRSNKIFTPNTI